MPFVCGEVRWLVAASVSPQVIGKVLFVEVCVVGRICELRCGGDSGLHYGSSIRLPRTLLHHVSLDPHLQSPHSGRPPQSSQCLLRQLLEQDAHFVVSLISTQRNLKAIYGLKIRTVRSYISPEETRVVCLNITLSHTMCT